MKKILILNDGSNYENWGIKACIDGLLKILNSGDVNFIIEGLPHSYMHRKYSFEPSIFKKKFFNENSRISKKFFNEFHELPDVADEFDFVADMWIKGNGGIGASHFIKKMNDIDILIFNGEGSTYRKNIGAVKGLFMLWFAKTRLNKKAYFLNGSVTLTRVDAVLPAMISKTFSIIDGISVREPYSKENIKSYCPSLDDISVIPDSVFSINPENKKSVDIKSKSDSKITDYFCFSLSMLPIDFKRSYSNSSLVKLIEGLKDVVPNVVLLAKDVEDQALRELSNDTNAFYIGSNYNYHEVMTILNSSKFLLSGRYHHLIFASKVGCPCIPLMSSSHKIHGLSKLFDGIMPNPYDPTNIFVEYDGIVQCAKNIVYDEKIRKKYIEKSNILKTECINGIQNLIS